MKEMPRFKLCVALADLMFLNEIVHDPSVSFEGDNYGSTVKIEIRIDEPIHGFMSDKHREDHGKEHAKVSEALRKIEEFIKHRNEIIQAETEMLINLGCPNNH